MFLTIGYQFIFYYYTLFAEYDKIDQIADLLVSR